MQRDRKQKTERKTEEETMAFHVSASVFILHTTKIKQKHLVRKMMNVQCVPVHTLSIYFEMAFRCK